jgi:hypothetical protein
VSELVASVAHMTLSIGMITMDSGDAQSLADWWATQLGADVLATNDGWYVMLGGDGMPVGLSFQKVADPTPGKNKLHLASLPTISTPRWPGSRRGARPSSSRGRPATSGG